MPYEIWDGDTLILDDIRDRRTAEIRMRQYRRVARHLSDPDDLHIVYAYPKMMGVLK